MMGIGEIIDPCVTSECCVDFDPGSDIMHDALWTTLGGTQIWFGRKVCRSSSCPFLRVTLVRNLSISGILS